MYKIKFKKGDLVKVISGKYKGIKGGIINLFREKNRVIIEGITSTKHIKPSQENSEGKIEQIPSSIHVSNIALIDPKNKKKITKISYKIVDNKSKIRIARKSKTHLS